MRLFFSAALIVTLALLVAVACDNKPDNSGYRVPRTPTPVPSVPLAMTLPPTLEVPMPEVAGSPVTTESGLRYIDIQEGTGAMPNVGQTVQVSYTGWLASTGRKFDSSVDQGRPFPFMFGFGQVIRGWDEGIGSMRVGGKRRLLIPPELGYGEAGFMQTIPPNAALIFDVELLRRHGQLTPVTEPRG